MKLKIYVFAFLLLIFSKLSAQFISILMVVTNQNNSQPYDCPSSDKETSEKYGI